MSSESQVWWATAGEDVAIILTGSTDPSGWTLRTYVREYPGATPTLTLTPTTSTSGSNYLITTSISAAQSAALTRPIYYVETFRTDSGSSVRLASGTLVLGPIVLTPNEWSASTGISTSEAGATSVSNLCLAVNDALQRRCYPNLLVPTTFTLEPFDAPPTDQLLLPRPIRSLSAIYVRSNANGDSTLLQSTDLLTANVDYWSKPDDRLTGWNRSGIVYRRGGRIWGYEYRPSLGQLSPSIDPSRGAVFVSGLFGPAAVAPAVREAAVRAVTLLVNSRTTGMPLQSESWGGYSYSAAGAFTAEAAINSPEVLGLLKSAGVLPYHFG